MKQHAGVALGSGRQGLGVLTRYSAAGILIMSVMLARGFGRFHGGL
ncbi:MAG: hypothetical protein ABR961_13785 [Thermoanaerobaculaceae bacterium]